MTEIADLLNLNFSSILIGVLMILLGMKSILSLLEWSADTLGIEFRWMRRKREDHELLLKTAQNLAALEEKRAADVQQSNAQDHAIRENLSLLSENVNIIGQKLDDMKLKNDAAEIAKLKDTILTYYKLYKDIGEWTRLESDAFWDLFKSYENHGGNGYIHTIVEPVMLELTVLDLPAAANTET